jgi:hypothetical protein
MGTEIQRAQISRRDQEVIRVHELLLQVSERRWRSVAPSLALREIGAIRRLLEGYAAKEAP